MNYRKMMRIAEDLERSLSDEIDERVEVEKDAVDVVEPSVEASDDEVVAYLTAQEKMLEEEKCDEMTDGEKETCIAAAEKLVHLAKRLQARKTELTASQKKRVRAYVMRIADGLGEDDSVSKSDVINSVGQKFSKNGPLLTKIKWKETSIKPGDKLRDLDLNDLRELLTHVI